MFGSKDDKKAPAAPTEKKGLFGWFRRKPETPAPAESAPELNAPAPAAIEATPEALRPETPELAAASAPAPVVAPAEVASVPVAPAPAEENIAPEPAVITPVAVASVEPELTEPAASPVAPLQSAPTAPEPVAVETVEPIDPTPAAPVQAAPIQAQTVQAAPAEAVKEPVAAQSVPVPSEPAPAASEKLGFFARLRQGLSKTSASIGEGMASLFLGKKAIDDDLLDELETRLLTADVGIEATTAIMQNLTKRVARKELADSGALYKALQQELVELLRPVEQPLEITQAHQPYVILVVGVNGAGKTTTIGKLAKRLQLDGKKVMLAAGDTFRAAAVEQLQVWGERNNIPVIAQHTGADSASVIFDAVQAAKARGIDVLIADTAGRLHTKDNLMEELKKVRRVMGKIG